MTSGENVEATMREVEQVLEAHRERSSRTHGELCCEYLLWQLRADLADLEIARGARRSRLNNFIQTPRRDMAH